MTGRAWNPSGPHSPRRTAQAGDLFDRLSRFLVYATAGGGVRAPAEAYVLIADLYLAAGRLPQLCGQLAEFLNSQAGDGLLRDDHGRDPAVQCALAEISLRRAGDHAAGLDKALQDAQLHIAGLALITGYDDDDDDCCGDDDDFAAGFANELAGEYGDA